MAEQELMAGRWFIASLKAFTRPCLHCLSWADTELIFFSVLFFAPGLEIKIYHNFAVYLQNRLNKNVHAFSHTRVNAYSSVHHESTHTVKKE